tara:strand:+ start:709 stop:1017 length:309 start_codon:yes stop_codon:yes gene_type:complete
MRNSSVKKTDLKTLYFNIYMTYVNSHTTLEDIGNKYDISKQRVWQIIRYCKLGNGDYYKGLNSYNRAYESFKAEHVDANSRELNKMMREWLKLNNIRLIKIK